MAETFHTMASVEDINGYFSSISSLANKIASDVELIQEICVQNGAWEELNDDEREQMIDRYMIDEAVVEKYASRKTGDDPPDCFPVLKIDCGEKVVVDFEHEDGWTWTDEHSAPFSWKTRSQQDLTLAELDEILNPKPEDAAAKKNRFAKRPRSPDRSVWETPFSNGNGSGKNEIEQMFEKFGIKMSTDDEEEGDGVDATAGIQTAEESENISSAILSRAENLTAIRYENKSFVFDLDDVPDSLQSSPSRALLPPGDADSSLINLPPNSNGSVRIGSSSGGGKSHKKSNKKEKSHRKEKRRHREKESEPTTPSTARPSATPMSGDIFFGSVRLDQVAVLDLHNTLVEDVDEDGVSAISLAVSEIPTVISFPQGADDIPSVHGSCRTMSSKIVIADGPLGESSTDDYLERYDDDEGEIPHLELSTSELLPVTPPTGDDSGMGSTVKTGFDFLDNW